MGSYKIGSECCNNCVHWDAERDDKHGKENVFSYKNCAKCTSSHSPNKGRSTLAENACPYFSHIWGITKTFSLSKAATSSTSCSVSSMSPGLDESSQTFLQATIDYMEAANRVNQERRIRNQEIKLDNRRILVENGMDPGASSEDQLDFEALYRRMAKSDAEAYYKMGNAFYYGRSGARKDRELAFKCFLTAVSKGCRHAEYSLGYCYYHGVGVGKNVLKAKKWLAEAADNGSSDAEALLIEVRLMACADSCASESDAAEFEGLIKRAINGDVEAQYELAVALSLGRRGAVKDRSRAAEWYEKAANAGKVEAIVGLADCYKDGDVSDKGITDAIPLYEKAASQGDWRAQHLLAKIYSSDEFDQKDYAKAVKWALLAADNDGTADVFCLLGKCYENGYGVGKNIVESVKFYQKAAQKDNEEAKTALERLGSLNGDSLYGNVKFGPGVLDADKAQCRTVYAAAVAGDVGAEYEMGNILSKGMYGILVDKKEAFGWYLKAAEGGHAYAQCEVASWYSLGVKDVVDWNDAEKFKWYWEAACQSLPEAMCKVADCFYYGSGVDKDDERAKWWYVRAAKAGDEIALDMLRNHWEMGDDEMRDSYGVIADMPPGMDPDADDSDKNHFRELFQKAQRGDVEAQFNLGHAFVYGEDGAKMNEHHGVMWLRRAAEQGNGDAENLLGDCYYRGWGVDENEPEAVVHYRKAAELGHVDAAEFLGDCYRKGKIVNQDRTTALLWYRVAAKESAAAQFWIGRFYAEGWGGLPQDWRMARECYEKAAEQGDGLAQFNLGKIYYFGKGVEKDYAKAVDWFSQSAEGGRTDAQLFVGTCYRRGLGVEKDLEKAFELYMKAAEDQREAKFWLGRFYGNGWGVVEKDTEKAFEWFLKSAEAGYVDAICAVGWAYQQGDGVGQDFAKAAEWFGKGVDKGDGFCANNLARLYEDGKGVEQNIEKALELFEIAVDKKCNRANYHLGRFYENGLGVDVDIDKAKEYYGKAAEGDDKDAKAALERLG